MNIQVLVFEYVLKKKEKPCCLDKALQVGVYKRADLVSGARASQHKSSRAGRPPIQFARERAAAPSAAPI